MRRRRISLSLFCDAVGGKVEKENIQDAAAAADGVDIKGEKKGQRPAWNSLSPLQSSYT